MPQYAPADLNLQHLYAFTLEGYKAIYWNWFVLLLLALLLDYVFDGANVLGWELRLKYSLLKAYQVIVD